MIIPLIAILIAYRIRTTYRIAQLKEQKKQDKIEESFEGSIGKMLDQAPKQLEQINSEIATIEQKCIQENIPEEKKKELLARLNQERDMLQLAVKYKGIAKPFVKPVGKIVNKVLSKIGAD